MRPQSPRGCGHFRLAHREREEFRKIHRAVFSSSVAVITTVAGRMQHSSALVERVRGALSESYAHRGLVFEKVIEQLPGRQAAATNPIFQVDARISRPAKVRLARSTRSNGSAAVRPARTIAFELQSPTPPACTERCDTHKADMFARLRSFESGHFGRVAGAVYRSVRYAHGPI